MKIKHAVIALIAIATAQGAYAQGGTNSPYSQYGLGALHDGATSFNRGMNGLGIAFRGGPIVNPLNPASYSAIDSLTFIFDVGMSGQITNFEQNNKRINANNASIEYAVASFRAFRHVGMSFGLLPYSTIGYNYSNSETISPAVGAATTTYTNAYNGSGGLHQAYIGIAWEPLKGLSAGANIAYHWGSISRSVINSYSTNTVNTLSKYYDAQVRNYKADFGLQYQLNIGKSDALTVGLTYSPGHNLKADPQCLIISKNAESGVADTTRYTIDNGLAIADTYGAGLSYQHGGKWRVGADYQVQKWENIAFPVYNEGTQTRYTLSEKYFQNRTRITLGGEYCPDELSRNYFKRMRYRVGASYTSPQLNINQADGPKEISVSAGFSFPITGRNRRRSHLNSSAQWVRQEAKGMIKESTFRLNIGLTFNERWFAKWKVE